MQLFVKIEKLVLIALQAVELRPEVVKEQRFYKFEDVFFAGVVRPKVPASLLIHDALEERAEDRRTDTAPIKSAAIEECLPHLLVERCDLKVFFKQLAVYVIEGSQLLV